MREISSGSLSSKTFGYKVPAAEAEDRTYYVEAARPGAVSTSIACALMRTMRLLFFFGELGGARYLASSARLMRSSAVSSGSFLARGVLGSHRDDVMSALS